MRHKLWYVNVTWMAQGPSNLQVQIIPYKHQNSNSGLWHILSEKLQAHHPHLLLWSVGIQRTCPTLFINFSCGLLVLVHGLHVRWKTLSLSACGLLLLHMVAEGSKQGVLHKEGGGQLAWGKLGPGKPTPGPDKARGWQQPLRKLVPDIRLQRIKS